MALSFQGILHLLNENLLLGRFVVNVRITNAEFDVLGMLGLSDIYLFYITGRRPSKKDQQNPNPQFQYSTKGKYLSLWRPNI